MKTYPQIQQHMGDRQYIDCIIKARVFAFKKYFYVFYKSVNLWDIGMVCINN